MYTIGIVALNFSFIIYFSWFVPQLYLTFKRKSTAGLSLMMHALLLFGYCSDYWYGFGMNLPLQYRLVTVAGLCALVIEHCQFAYYGFKHSRQKYVYWLITVFILTYGVLIGFALHFFSHSSWSRYAGYISLVCWSCYLWPQLIKNWQLQSVAGLSLTFIVLSIASTVCDVTAAFCLGWPMPSKLGAPLGLLIKTLILYQFYCYAKKPPSHSRVNLCNSAG